MLAGSSSGSRLTKGLPKPRSSKSLAAISRTCSDSALFPVRPYRRPGDQRRLSGDDETSRLAAPGTRRDTPQHDRGNVGGVGQDANLPGTRHGRRELFFSIEHHLSRLTRQVIWRVFFTAALRPICRAFSFSGAPAAALLALGRDIPVASLGRELCRRSLRETSRAPHDRYRGADQRRALRRER